MIARLFGRHTPRRENDAARFGIAVIGTGRVARKFIEALQGSESVQVSALISRQPENAKKLAKQFPAKQFLAKQFLAKQFLAKQFHAKQFNAKQFNVPQVLATSELAQLAHTRAVYLALPNAQHREYAERAAALGLHVLSEKPLAATIADAQAMIRCCKSAGVLLSPGYRFLFDPAYLRLREIVRSGALGKLSRIESDFGFVAKPDWRFDPAAAGGGSLFDVGVYPLRAFADLFPEAPLQLTSVKIQRDSATGLDMDTRILATIDGVATSCRSSYLADVPDRIHIVGERGSLTLHHAFDYTGCTLEADYVDANQQRLRFTQKPERHAPHTFRLEAEAFAAAVMQGTPPRSTGEEGLADMQSIAAIESYAASTPEPSAQ